MHSKLQPVASEEPISLDAAATHILDLRRVTERFVRISSRLLGASMPLLALGLVLEVYI